jgi:hypothetical protein
LAAYDGRDLMGFISPFPGTVAAWTANESPLGCFENRKAALAALRTHARNQ